jgi:hypothetical protein
VQTKVLPFIIGGLTFLTDWHYDLLAPFPKLDFPSCKASSSFY